MEHLIALAIITVPVCIWLMRRCRHKFEIINASDICNRCDERIGGAYFSRCKHCGKIKMTKFMAPKIGRPSGR